MRFLYFYLWQSFTKSPSNNSPATNAMIFLCIFQIVNLLTLLVYFNSLVELKFILDQINGYSLGTVLLFLVIVVADYFFLYKKRYQIAEKYNNVSKLMNIFGTIIAYLYAIGSSLLIYVVSKVFPIS